MNSLTDRDVIDKISDACEAGVRMLMIVRGICCIRANVPGRTDGLLVRQIVGRFLEHARVYAFGVDADTVYLSSADMMTRNTERRVEIAYPVLDPTCRSFVVSYMNLQLADNAKARQLTAEGTWERLERAEGTPRVDSQDLLLALAYRRSRAAQGAEVEALSPISVMQYQRPPRGRPHRLLMEERTLRRQVPGSAGGERSQRRETTWRHIEDRKSVV